LQLPRNGTNEHQKRLPYQHLGVLHGQPVKTNDQKQSSMITLRVRNFHTYSFFFEFDIRYRVRVGSNEVNVLLP
jgi:hypothetical protein